MRIEDYITARQAAEVTGFSHDFILKAARADRIDGAYRLGGRWFIPRVWAENHKKPPTATQAAAAAGVSRQTLYRRAKDDGYITTRQAAEMTGYSQQYICTLAANGKIEGAEQFGNAFKIPKAWAEMGKKGARAEREPSSQVEYITVRQAMEITGYSYTSLVQKSREGKIEGLEVFGNAFKIPREWAETHKRPVPGTGRRPAPKEKEHPLTGEYVTAHQAAEMTGYTYSNIIQTLLAGRIFGARRFGKSWRIPREWAETHKKPQTEGEQKND